MLAVKIAKVLEHLWFRKEYYLVQASIPTVDSQLLLGSPQNSILIFFRYWCQEDFIPVYSSDTIVSYSQDWRHGFERLKRDTVGKG